MTSATRTVPHLPACLLILGKCGPTGPVELYLSGAVNDGCIAHLIERRQRRNAKTKIAGYQASAAAALSVTLVCWGYGPASATAGPSRNALAAPAAPN